MISSLWCSISVYRHCQAIGIFLTPQLTPNLRPTNNTRSHTTPQHKYLWCTSSMGHFLVEGQSLANQIDLFVMWCCVWYRPIRFQEHYIASSAIYIWGASKSMTKDEYFKLCTALVQEQVYAWGIASSFVCLGSPPGMADAMLLKPNWSIV